MYHLIRLNNVAVGQGGALVNTCDETGGGVNLAKCENMMIIEPCRTNIQSNAVDLLQIATLLSSPMVVQVTQNLDAINDCDEEGTGFNLAFCTNEQCA